MALSTLVWRSGFQTMVPHHILRRIIVELQQPTLLPLYMWFIDAIAAHDKADQGQQEKLWNTFSCPEHGEYHWEAFTFCEGEKIPGLDHCPVCNRENPVLRTVYFGNVLWGMPIKYTDIATDLGITDPKGWKKVQRQVELLVEYNLIYRKRKCGHDPYRFWVIDSSKWHYDLLEPMKGKKPKPQGPADDRPEDKTTPAFPPPPAPTDKPKDKPTDVPAIDWKEVDQKLAAAAELEVEEAAEKAERLIEEQSAKPAAKPAPATKGITKMPVPLNEAPDAFRFVELCNGTIYELEKELGWAVKNPDRFDRAKTPTAAQWEQLRVSNFGTNAADNKQEIVAPQSTAPKVGAVVPMAAVKITPKKSSPPRSEVSDLLAETFFEDVLDSRKAFASRVPTWSMVFFEEKMSRQDGLHLIRCAGAWGWKEHIQKLRNDPVEFLLENKLAIYDDYVNSDFFDPEAEDTGEAPAGWHPGDDEGDLYDENDLYS